MSIRHFQNLIVNSDTRKSMKILWKLSTRSAIKKETIVVQCITHDVKHFQIYLLPIKIKIKEIDITCVA